MAEILGNITFNSNPIINSTIYKKSETTETVWLFESGDFYEGVTIKKIFSSKDSALLDVPDSFILFNGIPNYYENEELKQWIKISKMKIEKE